MFLCALSMSPLCTRKGECLRSRELMLRLPSCLADRVTMDTQGKRCHNIHHEKGPTDRIFMYLYVCLCMLYCMFSQPNFSILLVSHKNYPCQISAPPHFAWSKEPPGVHRKFKESPGTSGMSSLLPAVHSVGIQTAGNIGKALAPKKLRALSELMSSKAPLASPPWFLQRHLEPGHPTVIRCRFTKESLATWSSERPRKSAATSQAVSHRSRTSASACSEKSQIPSRTTEAFRCEFSGGRIGLRQEFRLRACSKNFFTMQRSFLKIVVFIM